MELQTARNLKMLGMTLFLLGLLTGFALSKFTNPRAGLAAHMEGVMNGTFLVVAGFVWTELNIGAGLRKACLGTLIYGTFANWIFTLLGAIFGTSRMTPIAGAGFSGTAFYEGFVSAGLISVGITMVFALVIMVYGLRGKVNA